jgi:hypothetical protein
MGSEGREEVSEEGALGGHLSLLVLLERVKGMGCEEVGVHEGAQGPLMRRGGDCGEGTATGRGGRV